MGHSLPERGTCAYNYAWVGSGGAPDPQGRGLTKTA
jgi:hypothetical protein